MISSCLGINETAVAFDDEADQPAINFGQFENGEASVFVDRGLEQV